MNTGPSTKNTLWEEKNSIEPKKNCLNNNAIEQKDIINDTNKNSMKNPCNDTGKISGIYKIVNKVNGKYYVGSSSHIKQRWYSHKKALRDKKHWNLKLQNAVNKHSIDNFEFVVVETCCSDGETLLSVEQKYLDIARMHVDNCYNITFTAGKVDMTDEIRSKMSRSKIGKYDGDKNHQYKNISNELFLLAKQVWISNGKNMLHSFLKKEHSLGGGVSRRLISEFKKDRNASALREENMKKLSKELYYQNYVNHGSKNPKYNPTIYKLFNENTKESFEGTVNEFFKKYGRYPRTSFLKGIRKSFHGWKLL